MAKIVSVRSVPPGGFETGTPGKQRAVFLDRDGVINSLDKFVFAPETMRKQLWPEAVEAIAKLSRESDYKIVLVTNQGGIDSGSVSDATMREIHGVLLDAVEAAGGRIDAIYYTPSNAKWVTPEGEISARKPEPGMFYRAARDFGGEIDLADSFMVGDMKTDIAAAEAAHSDLTSVLVKTGFGGKGEGPEVTPDAVKENLADAVDWILSLDSRAEAA